MKISERLTKEIISYIFANLGLVNPPLFGKAGINDNIYILHHFSINDEDGNVQNFPIYSAVGELVDSRICVAAICFFENGINEFALVLRSDNLPIYGIKQILDDNDVGIFNILSNGNWISASMQQKLKVCSGIDLLTDYGIAWIPEKMDSEMYDALHQIIEM